MKTKIKFYFVYAFFLTVLATLLSGCADHQSVEACVKGTHQYGFWGGLWHGTIAGFSFIGSWFSDDIAVYATNNNGGWYNFGFLLGIGALIGGGSRSRK